MYMLMLNSAQFDSAVADIVDFGKPQATGTVDHVSDSHLDLQSLHVLADSAVFGRYYNSWPRNRTEDLDKSV